MCPYPKGIVFIHFSGIWGHWYALQHIKWKTQVVPIWQKLSFWKKNVLTQFLIGSSIFHSPWHAHGLWKIEQTIKNCSWWSVEAGATYCLIYIFFRFYFWRFHVQKNIFLNIAQFLKSPWDSGTPRVWVYREKFYIDFLAQNFFPGFHTCIVTPPESLGEKNNVKFFTVDPYFWAMSFVGVSKSAENDTYC